MEMQETSRRNENKGYNIGLVSQDTTSDATVDWRGRPSNPMHHGGMKAASFVLGT